MTYCPKSAADDRAPPSGSHYRRDTHPDRRIIWVTFDHLRTARAQNDLYGPGSPQGLQAAEAAPNGGYVCGWPRRLDLHRDRHQVLMRRRASLRDSLTRGLVGRLAST